MKQITSSTAKQGQTVEIIGNYEYSRSFIGKQGIVVKIGEFGANLYVSYFNSGGGYEDSIFFFPYSCIATS